MGVSFTGRLGSDRKRIYRALLRFYPARFREEYGVVRAMLIRQSLGPIVAGAAGWGKFLQHLIPAAEPPGSAPALARPCS